MAVILIVEDDPLIRECAEMMMQEWGHETLAAGNVAAALDLLATEPRIEALATDIQLSKAADDGFQLARRAVAMRPDLRVLYMTGSSLHDSLTDLFVAGAHYIQKPYSEEGLRKSVDGLLAATP
jgi:CheY-like chemotaxis protein